jgi:Protein of unknown function (DUF3800)
LYLAYVDDSGDSQSFVLAAMLVPADRWLEVHDRLIAFRSTLSRETGFRMRNELHASEVISNGGAWRKLHVEPRRRMGIYKAALRELQQMAPVVRTVGVVVPNQLDKRLRAAARAEAWDVLMQRLERFCFHESSTCLLVPDDGGRATVRTMARRKRRFGYAPSAFGGGSQRVPFKQLVDDPVFRDSRESYLMQWTDLVAYAAFRTILPRPSVPPALWDDLGAARLDEANNLERRKGSAEPPGLIVWPSRLKPGSPL